MEVVKPILEATGLKVGRDIWLPDYVVNELVKALDMRLQKPLNGARILVLGIAYKKNVEDIRESPALRLIELLEARSACVDYHDPHVAVIPMTREHADLAGRESIVWNVDALTRRRAGSR